MKLLSTLLATAATTVLFANAAQAAQAAPAKHRAAAHRSDATRELLEEVRALRSEVQTLKTRLDGQTTAQVATQTEVQSTQAQVQQVQTQVAATQTQVETLPKTVQTQVDTSIDKARHADKLYMKGITLTPGGFVELAGIYREHFVGNDIASSFNAIPFPNSRVGKVNEGRFTARQSRVSLLAEGVVSPTVKLAMYGEFDFQGAAQTANSNESNSYNPRIRNLYGTVDWIVGGDVGVHLLAGQNWSLVTMNSKGITPRNEAVPPEVDAQYIPGFAWTRQPQIRATADFLDHTLWVAASAENPQTTFGGTIPANVTANATAGGGFDSANTLSLNHVPDFVVKAAYEAKVGGHGVHVEGFGLYRSFSEHLASGTNGTAHGSGYGGSISVQVIPTILDAQFSGMAGRGIGRYGASQLPDVTFSADGRIQPLHETMLLAGATLHATKMLDVYGFAGEERLERRDYGVVGTTLYGYGNPLANNSGCEIEGGTCAGNTHEVRQLTGGFWEKIYQGPFGRAQVGAQYSYTERTLFTAIGGGPRATQNMGLLSFRYYPF